MHTFDVSSIADVVRDCVRPRAEVTAKRTGEIEHVLHVLDRAHIPGPDGIRVVKVVVPVRVGEHVPRIDHVGHVELDSLVEPFRVLEHMGHVLYVRRIEIYPLIE